VEVNGKKADSEDAAWLDAITQLGCIVCRLYYFVFSPGEVHHFDGGSNHKHTICLCDRHHRNAGKGYETRHGNQSRFAAAYGTDWELYDRAKQLMGEAIC